MRHKSSNGVPLHTHPVDEIGELTALAFQRAATSGSRADWSDPQFQDALRQACEIAKGRGLQAEQLIILVREAWKHCENTPSLDFQARDDAIHGVVSLLIREFYRVPAPPSDGSREPRHVG